MSSGAFSFSLYVAKRVFQAIPVILAVVIVNFLLITSAPGDPLLFYVGMEGMSTIDPARLEILRHEFGLDRPIWEQLLVYLVKIFQGDMGFSYSYGEPVASVFLNHLPATLMLMLGATILSSVIGVILGVMAARKPHSIADYFLSLVSIIGYSMPTFFLAQLLVLLFAINLRLFPVGGMTSGHAYGQSGVSLWIDTLWHLVLPMGSLAMWQLALIQRQTRSKMLEILREDFILTAWAKGLKEKIILYRHALRNALLPIVTIVSMNLGFSFAGALMTETVFAWPGTGRVLYAGLLRRDYPLVLGLLIFITILIVAFTLITDVLYGVLDPRVVYRKEAKEWK